MVKKFSYLLFWKYKSKDLQNEKKTKNANNLDTKLLMVGQSQWEEYSSKKYISCCFLFNLKILKIELKNKFHMLFLLRDVTACEIKFLVTFISLTKVTWFKFCVDINLFNQIFKMIS